MSSQLTEEEEKAKNLSKLKNKQEMMIVDLEGEERALSPCPRTDILEEEANGQKHCVGNEAFEVCFRNGKIISPRIQIVSDDVGSPSFLWPVSRVVMVTWLLFTAMVQHSCSKHLCSVRS